MQDLRSYICEHTKEDLIDKIQSLDMSPEWVDDIMNKLNTSPQMIDAFTNYCKETKKLVDQDIKNILEVIEASKDKDLINRLMTSDISMKSIRNGISINKLIEPLKITDKDAKELAGIDLSKSNFGSGAFEALLICCLKDVHRGSQYEADLVSNDARQSIEIKVHGSRLGNIGRPLSDTHDFFEKTLRRNYHIDIDLPKDFLLKENSNIDISDIRKSMKDDELFDLLVQSIAIQYKSFDKISQIVDDESVRSKVITPQGIDTNKLIRLRFAIALKDYALRKNMTHLLGITDKGICRVYDMKTLGSVGAIFYENSIQIEEAGDAGTSSRSSQRVYFK